MAIETYQENGYDRIWPLQKASMLVRLGGGGGRGWRQIAENANTINSISETTTKNSFHDRDIFQRSRYNLNLRYILLPSMHNLSMLHWKN